MSSLFPVELELIMLPLAKVDQSLKPYYRKVVDCYEEVWLNLYQSVQANTPLFLDGLIRQDEAACLFLKGYCAGMILFRTVDFDFLNYRRDSYFKDWTDADIEILLSRGKRVFLATYLTVHPKFRGPELKLKEVFLNIMVKRFLESQADIIAGIARKDRGMHLESYKLGARAVREDASYMDGKFIVDLVSFSRAEIRMNPSPEINAQTEKLWTSRIDPLRNLQPELSVA